MSAQHIDQTDPHDQRTQIALLAMRLDTIGREKEQLASNLERECSAREESEKDIDKRIAKMEKSFQRGAGILMVLPIIGTMFGLLLAYGKAIFAPWTGSR